MLGILASSIIVYTIKYGRADDNINPIHLKGCACVKRIMLNFLNCLLAGICFILI